MTPHVNNGSELNWLLDDLVKRVPNVSKAVMLTQDGLAIGASSSLSREDAEHLAALASGFQSMARGAGQHFGGGRVRQTIIEMEAAFLFVSAAGQGTCLAVLSTGEADIGMVAYEMAVLVRRSNEHLAVAPRPGGPAGYGQDYPPQRPAPMGPGRGMAPPSYPVPPPSASPVPGAPSPYLPGGRMNPPSMAMPQPHATPSPKPVYDPYPTPAGRPGSAPYTE